MSIKVIAAVLDMAPAVVTPPERLVLVALGWHADEHGRNAWPAVSTLARKTSLTRRSVQRILHALKRKGFVYVESVVARRSVLYAIDMAALHCDTASQSKPYDYDAPSQSGRVHCELRSQSASDDCDTMAPPGDTVSPSLRHTDAPPATQCRPIRPLTVPEPSEKKNPAAARRVSAPDDHDDDHDDGDDYDDAALIRLAHDTFDALGEHAPFGDVEDDFRRRLNGASGPADILDNLGAFLFNLRNERRSRRTRQEQGSRWPSVGRTAGR